jgi:hypothetical protein
MATASTGWGVTCIAYISSETNTQANVTVDVYWQNTGWDYAISRVSAWANCLGSSVQVLNSASVNSTGVGIHGKVLVGSNTFVVAKGTSAQSIPCYGTITSNSSYVSGTKTSATTYVTVNAIPSYTVSYNLNGGSGTFNAQTKWYNYNLTLHNSTPTRTGYIFLGWSTYPDGSVAYGVGATYTANAGATLYAVWQIITYTVYYNANGGSGVPAEQTKKHGEPLTLSSVIPTRTNYTFLGWSTYQNATLPQYFPGGTFTSNCYETLYAVWELSYVAPRISNLTIARCNADGTLNEEGTSAKISFNWATDRSATAYAVYYKRTIDTNYSSTSQVTLSGTSGSVSAVIKNVTFDTEYSYDIKLNVADSNGYSSKFILLNALYIAIDCTEDGKSMSFGSPCPEDIGLLQLAFDTVNIAPNVALQYRGQNFFGGRLIWSGSSVFTETNSITLDKPMSEMKNGILLVFGRNTDYNLTPCFIPKETVATIGRTNYCFTMATALFDYIGTKTVYVSDTKIEGYADNDSTGKNATSGITYHNEAFYLRYVYEV